MATVAESLFGVTPESLQRQRQQQLRQEAMNFASISDPFQQANFAIYQGAGNLARGVGGMLGAQDPELMRVRQRQELLQGVNPADPASLREAAQRAMAANDFQAAQLFSDRALSAETTQAKLESERALTNQRNRERAAADPFQQFLRSAVGKVTPESLATYQQSGNPSDLVWTEKANQTEIERLQAYRNSLPAGSRERLEVDAVIKGAAEGRGTKVNVNANMPPQEKAEQSGRGTFLVKQYEDISKQAGVARRTLPALESIANILDKGFDTGFGTETITAGAKVLGALGVEGAKNLATNAESFLGAASSAVLTKQLEQKGPQTESDAQRITQTGAQLGNTKEANRFLITVAKAQLQRDIAQRNFYDSWWKKNKTYDGAEDAWETGEGSRSLFDYPELRKYRATPSAAAQIPTSQGTPATPTYARNPQTGQRIMSTDGGKTWQPAR